MSYWVNQCTEGPPTDPSGKACEGEYEVLCNDSSGRLHPHKAEFRDKVWKVPNVSWYHVAYWWKETY